MSRSTLLVVAIAAVTFGGAFAIGAAAKSPGEVADPGRLAPAVDGSVAAPKISAGALEGAVPELPSAKTKQKHKPKSAAPEQPAQPQATATPPPRDSSSSSGNSSPPPKRNSGSSSGSSGGSSGNSGGSSGGSSGVS